SRRSSESVIDTSIGAQLRRLRPWAARALLERHDMWRLLVQVDVQSRLSDQKFARPGLLNPVFEAEQRALTAALYHAVPLAPTTPAFTRMDFHESLAALMQYPVLLSRLGLVLDFPLD